jgi:hypothetical protein
MRKQNKAPETVQFGRIILLFLFSAPARLTDDGIIITLTNQEGLMPSGKVIQFQVVALPSGSQVIYVLMESGILYFSNPTVGDGAWQAVSHNKPDESRSVSL